MATKRKYTKPQDKYPPTKAQVTRWKIIEQDYLRLIRERYLRSFVELFKESLGTLAANKPYDAWPKEFKDAFQHARRRYGYDIANEYKDQLPLPNPKKPVEELSNGN